MRSLLRLYLALTTAAAAKGWSTPEESAMDGGGWGSRRGIGSVAAEARKEQSDSNSAAHRHTWSIF